MRSTCQRLFLLALFPLFLLGCETMESTNPGPTTGNPSLEVSGPVTSVESASACVSGRHSRNALYEICRPEAGAFNGTLVVYVHGFIFPQAPLQIPEIEGGVDVADFVLSRGFAYAATSLYKNGVVDPNKGVEDVLDLVRVYENAYGTPERVLLLSFSNGSYLATLAIEKNPGVFDGALAACGPIGSFRAAAEYLADVSVLFDFYFGDVEIFPGAGAGVPGGPEGVPPAFLAELNAMAPAGATAVDVLLQGIVGALISHPDKTAQLLGTLQLTSSLSRGTMLFVPGPEALELVVSAVAYNVFVTNDGLTTFGGRYFDNRDRVYADLLPDESIRTFINASIARYDADRNVLAQLDSRYESKGKLRQPMVALHTVRDPRVPIWQEHLYLEDLGAYTSNFELRVIDRYGHCTFTEEEVNEGLQLLMSRTEGSVASR